MKPAIFYGISYLTSWRRTQAASPTGAGARNAADLALYAHARAAAAARARRPCARAVRPVRAVSFVPSSKFVQISCQVANNCSRTFKNNSRKLAQNMFQHIFQMIHWEIQGSLEIVEVFL